MYPLSRMNLMHAELDMNGDEVNRERFPLPTLGGKLDRCAVEVHFGTGMCMIRGIDPGNYSIEDNMVIFLGISSYIGDQRGLQSAKGAMLCMVFPQAPPPFRLCVVN
jgi:hypothetical protein